MLKNNLLKNNLAFIKSIIVGKKWEPHYLFIFLKKIAYGLVFGFFVLSPAWADDSSNGDSKSVDVSKWVPTQLKLSVFALQAVGFNAQQTPLINSVSNYIYGQVASISTHYFSDENKNKWAKYFYRKQIQDVYKDYRDTYQKLQALEWDSGISLNDSNNSSSQDSQSQLEQQLKTDKQTIDQYNQITTKQINIPDELPILINALGSSSGDSSSDGDTGGIDASSVHYIPAQNALGPPSLLTNQMNYMLTKKVDICIWGKIYNLDGQYDLVIYYQSVCMDRPIKLEKVIPYKDTTMLHNWIYQLKTMLLGYPYGSLQVDVFPKDARVYVNHQLKSIGSYRQKHQQIGVLQVRVLRAGYFPYTEYIQLKKKANIHIQVSLLPQMKNLLAVVDSQPEGADVYLNSRWIGKTPVPLMTTEEAGILSLQLPGYARYQKTIPQLYNSHLLVKLNSNENEESFEQARNRFYTSLTFFGLSLTAFLTTNAWFGILNSLPSDPYISKAYINTTIPTRNALFWANIGTSSMMIGCAIWMLCDLFLDFLPQAQKNSGGD